MTEKKHIHFIIKAAFMFKNHKLSSSAINLLIKFLSYCPISQVNGIINKDLTMFIFQKIKLMYAFGFAESSYSHRIDKNMQFLLRKCCELIVSITNNKMNE